MDNLKNSNKIKDNDDFINFNSVYRILKKRLKIIKVTSVFLFSLSIVYTAHSRIYKPVYKGDFILLIKNPIGQSESGGSSEVSMFQQLALGKKIMIFQH